MNDGTSSSHSAGKRTTRLLAGLVLVAFVLGSAGYWHTQRYRRHFLSGLEAAARGDLDAVRSAAEALRGVAGYESHVHLLEGLVLLRSQRLHEAVEEFGHARDHPDTLALAYALSGEALYRGGHLADAQRILAAALDFDPSLIDARRWLAAAYYDVGAMNHAIGHLDLVAAAAPDDPRPHRLIGLIYRDFEQYRKATDAYRESLRRDPHQADRDQILVELAECLVKQQRYDEALETLPHCPPSADVLVLLAECLHGRNDPQGAMDSLAEALAITPDHLAALQLAAMIELESGDAEAAARRLRQAIEYHPKAWRLRYQLLRAYHQLGEAELAQREGEVMRELRELRDRFTALHDRAMENPTDAEIRYQLGVAAAELGWTELAHGWYRTALALAPNHAGARRALALAAPAAPREETTE